MAARWFPILTDGKQTWTEIDAPATEDLVGAAAAGAQASAALDYIVISGMLLLPPGSLIGSAVGRAESAAALGVDKAISGEAASTGVADAKLDHGIVLDGGAASSAQGDGHVDLTVTLEGDAVGDASGDAEFSPGVTLKGSAQASAGASGQVRLDFPIEGVADASAQASGGVSVTVNLQGDAEAVAVAVAKLLFQEASAGRRVQASASPRAVFVLGTPRTITTTNASRMVH